MTFETKMIRMVPNEEVAVEKAAVDGDVVMATSVEAAVEEAAVEEAVVGKAEVEAVEKGTETKAGIEMEIVETGPKTPVATEDERRTATEDVMEEIAIVEGAAAVDANFRVHRLLPDHV